MVNIYFFMDWKKNYVVVEVGVVFSRNLFRPSFLSCHLLPETNTKAAEIWNFSFAPVTFLSDLLGFPFGERAKIFYQAVEKKIVARQPSISTETLCALPR